MDSSRQSGLPKPRPALLGAHSLFIALVLAAVLCAHAFGGVDASSSRCRQPACHVSLSVGAEGARFVSKERFYPSREAVSVRLSTAGQKLRVIGRGGAKGCITRFAAPGIRAVARVCWEGGPLNLFTRRNWGGSVDLEMTYAFARRARIPQGVKGIQAGSGTPTSSGGIGPHGR